VLGRWSDKPQIQPVTSSDIWQKNRSAIGFMLLAMTAFVFNDMSAKLASEELPTGQIILVRGLIATPLIILIAWWQGAFRHPALLFHKTVWLRTLGEVLATAMYLTALFNMPIANATAILQTVPLATTAAAALILREKVGIRRWLAITLGFAGVLLIVRPGSDGFTIWSLLALGAVGALLLRDLSSRVLPPAIPALGITALSTVAITLLGGVMSLSGDWQPISLQSYLYLCAAAVLLLSAHYFILYAMRHGELSVVAPFRYAIMLWAIVIQIVVFGLWPDLPTLAGSAILVATGLYTLYRERVVGQQQDTPPIAGHPPYR
jgi:drug/metabolite transporter (DMT)-like permease